MKLVDDLEVENFMHQECSYLFEVGLLYSSWRPSKRSFSISQIILYFTCVIIFSTAECLCALAAPEMEVITQSIELMIVAFCCIIVMISYSLQRSNIVALFRMFMEGLHGYDDEFVAVFDKKRRRRTRQMYFTILFFNSLLGFVAAFSPTVESLFGSRPPPTKNGVHYNFPLAIWAPFDLNQSWFTFLLTYMLFGVCILVFAGGVACADCALVYFCFRVMSEIEILVHCTKIIKERASARYAKEKPISVQEFDQNVYYKCYENCFNDHLRHFQQIQKAFKLLVDIVNISFTGPLAGGSALIAMSTMSVITPSPRIGPKLISAGIGLLALFNINFMAMYTEFLNDLIDEVRLTMFSNPWYKCSRSLKTSTILFQLSTIRPFTFTCMKIFKVEMKTFVTVVQTAYSYINLMWALKS